jgi:hypothetical protein
MLVPRLVVACFGSIALAVRVRGPEIAEPELELERG